MNNQSILYGVIGLLSGSLLMLVLSSYAVNSNNTGFAQMMGLKRMMDTDTGEKVNNGGGVHMGSSMSQMMGSLDNLKGEDFDAAFIDAMIVHHEGAIGMAESAEENALHPEIKQLAKEIIAAQTKEIDMMKAWKENWGYTKGTSLK